MNLSRLKYAETLPRVPLFFAQKIAHHVVVIAWYECWATNQISR